MISEFQRDLVAAAHTSAPHTVAAALAEFGEALAPREGVDGNERDLGGGQEGSEGAQGGWDQAEPPTSGGEDDYAVATRPRMAREHSAAAKANESGWGASRAEEEEAEEQAQQNVDEGRPRREVDIFGGAAPREGQGGTPQSRYHHGVRWDEDKQRWAAEMRLPTPDSEGLVRLGLFSKEVDAAECYDKNAVAAGPQYPLNFGPGGIEQMPLPSQSSVAAAASAGDGDEAWSDEDMDADVKAAEVGRGGGGRGGQGGGWVDPPTNAHANEAGGWNTTAAKSKRPARKWGRGGGAGEGRAAVRAADGKDGSMDTAVEGMSQAPLLKGWPFLV